MGKNTVKSHTYYKTLDKFMLQKTGEKHTHAATKAKYSTLRYCHHNFLSWSQTTFNLLTLPLNSADHGQFTS